MSSGNYPAGLERYLKKIYDCLNKGSNKKAVQEVDRLPKNMRDLTVSKSLKAFALVRMNKRRQAFDILDEIDLHANLDDVTLQTMTSCFKESVALDRIVDLYEAAAEKKPTDQEIMAHLFMAHVRVFNFKRQKEIALQMYKNFAKKRLYSFWAIMSLVMQSQEVHGSSNESDRKVCLSLAEKMCEKMIDDERSHEEIELYLMILRKQQKHEEEYRFLTGQFCLRITDHLSWFNRRRAYLCLDLKMYSRAFKHYFPTLIQEYPDQIEYYQGLFKSAFLLDTEAPSQQQPIAINDQQSSQSIGTPVKSTSALAECYDIVEKQCQLAIENVESKDQSKSKGTSATKALSNLSQSNRKRTLRGPFISRIELYHTIKTNENALTKNIYNQCLNQFATKFHNLVSLLLDFFQSFSRKMICYYDMVYMLNRYKISEEEESELVNSIGAWVQEVGANQPDLTTYDIFYINLNYHALKHSLKHYNITDTKEYRLDLAKVYVDLYDENRELGMQTSKTEFLPVDHYCLLAINSVMTNAISSAVSTSSNMIINDQTLVNLIVMAENATNNSPCNHQIKLILLKLYSLIGASKQSSEVLLSLDIKHFQIDTLGHLLNPVLYNTGNYTLSKESLETCLEFYMHGVRECFEGLTTGYRDGRFSKIGEISRVLRRLSDSLNATQCILLSGVVSNLNAASFEELSLASQSFDQYKSLYRLFRSSDSAYKIKDGRDFKVLKSLHFGVDSLVQERQQRTFEDEELWLRLRYYLMRCAYLQFDYFVTNGSNGGCEKSSEVQEIEYGIREIDDLMVKMKERLSVEEDNRYSFLEPEASPFRWQHINISTLIDIVKPFVSCTHPSSLTQDVFEDYLNHLETIVCSLEERLTNTTSLVAMKQTLMSMTISLEFISLCVTSLVSVSHYNSSSLQFSNNKAPPKLVQNQQVALQTAPKSKPFVQQMINKTEAQLTKLSGVIKGFDLKSSISDKIIDLDERLLSHDKHSCSVVGCKSGVASLLMPKLSSQNTLLKVKEKIVDSYNDSLRELDSTCRKKVKLLRSKA